MNINFVNFAPFRQPYTELCLLTSKCDFAIIKWPWLLFQISTSAPTEHTAVMLMLCVTTPEDLITARAKMDFMEME